LHPTRRYKWCANLTGYLPYTLGFYFLSLAENYLVADEGLEPSAPSL